jgi:hypothetical protein
VVLEGEERIEAQRLGEIAERQCSANTAASRQPGF